MRWLIVLLSDVSWCCLYYFFFWYFIDFNLFALLVFVFLFFVFCKKYFFFDCVWSSCRGKYCYNLYVWFSITANNFFVLPMFGSIYVYLFGCILFDYSHTVQPRAFKVDTSFLICDCLKKKYFNCLIFEILYQYRVTVVLNFSLRCICK